MTKPTTDFAEASEELYFGGMELHGNVLFARKYFGRKGAAIYLKWQRHAATLYLEDRAGFSVRDTPGLTHPEKARRAAALRIALIDKLTELIRSS